MIKVGDIVVCVNDKGAPTLKLKNEYSIKEILRDGEGVALNEVRPFHNKLCGFYSWRFRKLNDINIELEEQISECLTIKEPA